MDRLVYISMVGLRKCYDKSKAIVYLPCEHTGSSHTGGIGKTADHINTHPAILSNITVEIQLLHGHEVEETCT